MQADVLPRIRSNYNGLSSSQKKIADYVLNYPNQVMVSSMYDLASACGVSEATIMRFLRKLDYDSYQLFRVHLAQQLGSGTGETIYDKNIQKGDSIASICHKVIAVTAQSILDAEPIIDVTQLEAILTALIPARRVLVIGMGSSSALALDLAHKLQRVGIYATYSSDAHMINMMTTNLGKPDVLLAISHSGESREILSGLKNARENGVTCIGITSYPKSSLVSLCHHVLLSSSIETQYRSDALLSRIVQMAIMDMIYVGLALKLGDKAEERIDRTRSAVAASKK